MPTDKSLTDMLREAFVAHLGATCESLHKIKLGRGAVGKIAVIAVAALVAIGAVALRLSTAASILVAIIILGIICLASLGCVLYVLMKNPEMALLEGAELVLYQHITLGAKGQPPLAAASAPITEPLALNAEARSEHELGEGK
jgi:hypothetical protein